MRMTSSHSSAAILAAVLAEHGIRHVVTSPGSRNAPLVLAFHHQPEIKVHVCIDERSAAYVALGMALSIGIPVPVICTSGTAALNHGPALAEAFHSHIPLLSISADRPQEVIGRGHGQSIEQSDIHRPHTVHQDVLDESVMSLEVLTEKAQMAVHLAMHGGRGGSCGPVHLNVPFEEPLYDLAPYAGRHVAPTIGKKAPQSVVPESTSDASLNLLHNALDRGRALVVAGSRPLMARLPQVAPLQIALPCLAECGSHVEGPQVEFGAERWVSEKSWKDDWKPEAVLTVGLPPMSKVVRNALRGIPHWHVRSDLAGFESGWDIWNRLEGHVHHSILQTPLPQNAAQWWDAIRLRHKELDADFTCQWSDLLAWRAIAGVFSSWPEHQRPQCIHVANSASIRYAQYVQLQGVVQKGAAVYANRGVAGIDGCTSTALGWHLARQASKPDVNTWLITGDLAFHYDVNAMLIDSLDSLKGFKIVVMNNSGGGIFRWLPGTKHATMFEKHFETPTSRSIAGIATSLGAHFSQAHHIDELTQGLDALLENEELGILEICTPAEQSAVELTRYMACHGQQFSSSS